jgi:hypothetical protein
MLAQSLAARRAFGTADEQEDWMQTTLWHQRDLARAIDALALDVAASVHAMSGPDGRSLWPWTDCGGEATGALFRFVRSLLAAYCDGTQSSDAAAVEASVSVGAAARAVSMSLDAVIESATQTMLACELAIDRSVPPLSLVASARSARINSLVCRGCVMGLSDDSVAFGVRPTLATTQRILLDA